MGKATGCIVGALLYHYGQDGWECLTGFLVLFFSTTSLFIPDYYTLKKYKRTGQKGDRDDQKSR